MLVFADLTHILYLHICVSLCVNILYSFTNINIYIYIFIYVYIYILYIVMCVFDHSIVTSLFVDMLTPHPSGEEQLGIFESGKDGWRNPVRKGKFQVQRWSPMIWVFPYMVVPPKWMVYKGKPY